MPEELNPSGDDRFEQIATRVEPYLRDNERILVGMSDGHVWVEDASICELERRAPRLYGRLLSLDERLQSGCSVTVFFVALFAFAAFALYSGLLQGWLGADLNEKLRSWWFYGLLLFAGAFAGNSLQASLDGMRYRRAKPGLTALLRETNADWDELIAEMHHDPTLANVLRHMKLDPQSRHGDRP